MTRLRDLDLELHLADPARKQEFVTPMFELVAPSYDAFTRAFSYGMDARWKGTLISLVARDAPPGARILDLACGTGDLALAASAVVPGARITGIDASERMLEIARTRGRGAPHVEFRLGTVAALDQPAASADAVTAGYAFRNAPDRRVAVAEAARVLKRGGMLAVLDFYVPASPVWRRLFLGYLRVAGNFVGWLWHREPVSYGYLAPSIAAYVTAGAFSDDLRAAGFDVVRVEHYLMGGVAMHVARKR